jgi:hypothetical protein
VAVILIGPPGLFPVAVASPITAELVRRLFATLAIEVESLHANPNADESRIVPTESLAVAVKRDDSPTSIDNDEGDTVTWSTGGQGKSTEIGA